LEHVRTKRFLTSIEPVTTKKPAGFSGIGASAMIGASGSVIGAGMKRPNKTVGLTKKGNRNCWFKLVSHDKDQQKGLASKVCLY